MQSRIIILLLTLFSFNYLRSNNLCEAVKNFDIKQVLQILKTKKDNEEEIKKALDRITTILQEHKYQITTNNRATAILKIITGALLLIYFFDSSILDLQKALDQFDIPSILVNGAIGIYGTYFSISGLLGLFKSIKNNLLKALAIYGLIKLKLENSHIKIENLNI